MKLTYQISTIATITSNFSNKEISLAKFNGRFEANRGVVLLS